MAKKDAYIAKAQARINEQIAKLDQLKARAKGEVADQKLKSQEKIQELEAKIEGAKAHLSEIPEAAEDAWENLKNKLDVLADDIGSSFQKFFGKDKPESPSKDAGSKAQEK